MILNPEQTAYWYFRLNGFFTIQNFIVHPDIGGRQHTDADIIGDYNNMFIGIRYEIPKFRIKCIIPIMLISSAFYSII